jgi:hypothetical protein
VDEEAANHYVAQRDAIDLPLFELTEEGAHRDSGRERSIGDSRHSVEPAIGVGEVFSRRCARVCARMTAFLLAI